LRDFLSFHSGVIEDSSGTLRRFADCLVPYVSEGNHTSIFSVKQFALLGRLYPEDEGNGSFRNSGYWTPK
jgi:hypothetical protein